MVGLAVIFLQTVNAIPAAAEKSTLLTIFSELMPYASIIWSAYVFYMNRNKDETKAFQDAQKVQADKLKKLEQDVEHQKIINQSFQTERERLVDQYDQRLATIDKRVSQVDQVLHKVNELQIKLESQNNQIAKLEKTMDKTFDKLDKMNDILMQIKLR